jgi:ubiquinone/menaquinone biosynthesis C-methylase UbiE
VDERTYGMGRGKVFPASDAKSLLHPLRRLVQSPARTVAAMQASPTDRVLEVGSGPGFFTPHLADAVRAGQVVAMDLQYGMVAMARDRTSPLANVALVQADAAVLPFAEGAFAGALVATVLGEVPDRPTFLRELRRVLRPGGILSISETRRDSDFIRLAALRTDVEAQPFTFLGRTGNRWQYLARFAAT